MMVAVVGLGYGEIVMIVVAVLLLFLAKGGKVSFSLLFGFCASLSEGSAFRLILIISIISGKKANTGLGI